MTLANILCLGSSYTARYASDNFSTKTHFHFLSRHIGKYSNLSYLNSLHFPKKLLFILDTIPPAENTNQKPFYFDIIRNLIAKDKNIPYIHISSTSVFPKHHKKNEKKIPVYNENSIALPDTEIGKRRLLWEKNIKHYYPQAKILRSTGIYGPKEGRSIIEKFQNGNFSRAQQGNCFVSRIHVHDIIRLAFAMAYDKTSPSLVHAVDEATVPYQILFSFIEKELKITLPDLSWRKTNPLPKGRIIQSLHAKKLLKGVYSFPSYKEGFRAII